MNSHLKIGVFVDAENIRYNGGFHMRYDMLRRFAARNGGELLRLNTYMAYDRERAEQDTEYGKKAQGYQQMVRDFGWKVIAKEVRRYTDEDGNVTTKANADLDMAVDAMLQADNLDLVLMVTGDGDFIQVVNALQNKGCRVETLAFKNISQELKKRSDDFFSGFLIPDLLPIHYEPQNNWGTVGSVVRGVCNKWFPDKGYGFMRYIHRLDPNLWITDPRDPESPYESVFCHINELAEGINAEHLMNRENVFEFYLRESGQKEGGMKAENVRMVPQTGRWVPPGL